MHKRKTQCLSRLIADYLQKSIYETIYHLLIDELIKTIQPGMVAGTFNPALKRRRQVDL